MTKDQKRTDEITDDHDLYGDRMRRSMKETRYNAFLGVALLFIFEWMAINEIDRFGDIYPLLAVVAGIPLGAIFLYFKTGTPSIRFTGFGRVEMYPKQGTRERKILEAQIKEVRNIWVLYPALLPFLIPGVYVLTLNTSLLSIRSDKLLFTAIYALIVFASSFALLSGLQWWQIYRKVTKTTHPRTS